MLGLSLIWIVLVVSWLSKAIPAALVIRPRDSVTLEGSSPVTLHCTTSASDGCHWVAANSANEVPVSIYDGDDQKLNTSLYLVDRSSPGQCDLVVLKPTMSSWLMYGCSADKWLDETAYASLTILKSNLMCDHNADHGKTLGSDQTVRYSFHVRYVGNGRLFLYRESRNGSVAVICDARTRDGNVWRLECDYEVRLDEVQRFFAAVGKAGTSRRFYCARADELAMITAERPRDSADTVTPHNVTMVTPAASDVVAPHDDMSSSHGCLVFVLPICLPVLLIVVVLSVVMAVRFINKRMDKKSSHEIEKGMLFEQ